MAKKTFKPATMLYPLPAVMVSCGNEKESDIITVAWTGIINSEPPYTYISVRKERNSHHILKENMEFCINMVPKGLSAAMDFAGCTSGRKVDKWEKLKLHKEQGENVSCPMIAESPAVLECRVFEIKEFPSHDMFMAEIVAVHVDEKYVSDAGRIMFDKMDLVSLQHGQYYATGKYAGKMGFSVRKK